MRPGLVSSAAYEIQLTADCELLQLCAARGRLDAGETVFPPRALLQPSWTMKAGMGRALRERLKEAADRLAGYTEADDLAREIDVGDRVGRDQAAMA